VRLIDCFIPALAYLRHFQRQPGGDLVAVRLQFEQLLGSAMASAESAQKNPADSQAALFAVVAWADEVFLASAWSGASQWARQLFQRQYFNVSNAGDAFFSRLELLSAAQIEVREVYLYALSLGFAGRYGYDRDAKALADVRQASQLLVMHDLRGSGEALGLSSDMHKFMFPEGYATAGGSIHPDGGHSDQDKRWRWKLSSLTVNVVMIPLIILIVLYTVFHTLIWQAAKALMVQIL
jgi:type VI secretion system protein ImpK